MCIVLWMISCQKEDPPASLTSDIRLEYARLGSQSILHGETVAPDGELIIGFSKSISNTENNFFSLLEGNALIPVYPSWSTDAKEVRLTPEGTWQEGVTYRLMINDQIESSDGSRFAGDTLIFTTQLLPLTAKVTLTNGRTMEIGRRNPEIPLEPTFHLELSHLIPETLLYEHLEWVGDNQVPHLNASSENEWTLTFDRSLNYYTSYELHISEDLGPALGRPFEGLSFSLFSTLDSTYKFPEISDEELLTKIQQQTFRYFWEGAEPISGMARERNTSNTTVTTGGTGFGLMAMVVAVERGFIARTEAVERWGQILYFLEQADRFHGAWPHWINGMTGKVQPFSAKDNGADLVETAFLIQGMLTVREYLDPDIPEELELIDLINKLWKDVEWDWFSRDGQNVLYWHWSPEYEWDINLPIQGHNETQIVYILAAGSPEHSINFESYHEGYARSGNIKNGTSYYGLELPVGPEYGGPLFFAHYSYLGLDPRGLRDDYADYFTQNLHHTLINRSYCIDNPRNFIGYSEDCWGLTASDGNEGYSAHSPRNDRGVITPTAAISSIPYTHEESMAAIRHFYYLLGDRIWGEYGFFDAFNITEEWVADSYLAIDQGPIVCMIENYRTGLLWELFMGAPEIQAGLEKLNIRYE